MLVAVAVGRAVLGKSEDRVLVDMGAVRLVALLQGPSHGQAVHL